MPKDETKVPADQVDPNIKMMSVILEMFKSTNNSIAIQNRLTIEFIEDMKQYRSERSKAESEKTLSTDQKIDAIIMKRFEWWYYLRERVVPAILIAVILAILKFLKFI